MKIKRAKKPENYAPKNPIIPIILLAIYVIAFIWFLIGIFKDNFKM